MDAIDRLKPYFVTMVLTVVIGCAPGYHSYSGCRVNCNYCAPQPLPFTHYPECICHSCVARPYLYIDATAVDTGDMTNSQTPAK